MRGACDFGPKIFGSRSCLRESFASDHKIALKGHLSTFDVIEHIKRTYHISGITHNHRSVGCANLFA